MAVLGRLVVMTIAYSLACVVASFVFTIGMFAPQWVSADAADLPPIEALWVLVAVGAPVIWIVALVPAMLTIAIAEGFAWRSAVGYALIGGALALAVSYGVHVTGDIADAPTYYPREREVEAASGIAGGLVYWLLAGRRAGAWTRSRTKGA